MLSKEEKLELVEDARDGARRQHFQAAKKSKGAPESFDDYILFLNSVQKIFSPFVANRLPTQTKRNLL